MICCKDCGYEPHNGHSSACPQYVQALPVDFLKIAFKEAGYGEIKFIDCKKVWNCHAGISHEIGCPHKKIQKALEELQEEK